MHDPSKTLQELIEENAMLKQKIQELEISETERKRMEEALRASELKYQTIFETTGTTMLIVEEDMTIFLANDGFESLTGYTREEVEGKRKWTEFVEKADLEKMITQHQLRRTNLELATKSYEFRLAHRDGYKKNIILTVDIIPGTKRSVASLMDITELKHTEDALRESEKKYRQLFMNAPAAIYEVDYRNHRFIRFNDIIPTLTGYFREELMQMDPWDLFTEESWKTYLNRMSLMKKGKDVSASQEYTLRKKDGGILWVNTNIDYDIAEDGLPVRARIVAHDITERKKAEAALLESEIKFKSFAEQALVGAYLLQDGVFKYVNPKFAQMFGYTVEECLNDMPFENLIYEEDVANVKEQIRRRISGEVEFVHYTFRGMKKNGQIFFVEIYGSSSVHRGRPAAAGTLLDISERKQAEEERERLISELQKALSEVKTLSGLLPICASCKKIRDDKGYWNQIESYIKAHSRVEFSHGICPECAKKLYPEFYKEK